MTRASDTRRMANPTAPHTSGDARISAERIHPESARRAGLEASTQGCSRHRHREFVLTYDERRTPSADVRRLIDSLERAVARGERFHPGETVRVGWLSLRVALAEDGQALTLLEPDFVPLGTRDSSRDSSFEMLGGCGRMSETPTRWVVSVDEALCQLRFQQDFAEGAGLGDQLVFSSIEHRAKVCRRLLECDINAGFVLDRAAPLGGDSGWMIGCTDAPAHAVAQAVAHEGARDGRDGHATVECTLYEVASRWPFLVDFLALPAATTIACTETGEAIVFHEGREVAIRSGHGGPRISRVTRPGTLARCVR